MEVKAGSQELIDGNLIKIYGYDRCDVACQSRVQHAAMVNRLQNAGLHAHVANCVVLPDFLVQEANIVALPRERIINAKAFDQQGTLVREMLDRGCSQCRVEDFRRFLGNYCKVSVNSRVLGEQLRLTNQRLSDGLATWAPRIVSPSGVVRVQATAGRSDT